MTGPAERAAVAWSGQGQPITLSLHSCDGSAAAISLTPKDAMVLAQELQQFGVAAVKADWWGVE